MPPRKLTPVQVLERLLIRLEKRMEALQRVKLDGFQMVISELEVEQDYLRRAMRYLGSERLSVWDYRLSKSACEESFCRLQHLALQALFA
jgi:uncharacterized coiled-coil protein SlyX